MKSPLLYIRVPYKRVDLEKISTLLNGVSRLLNSLFSYCPAIQLMICAGPVGPIKSSVLILDTTSFPLRPPFRIHRSLSFFLIHHRSPSHCPKVFWTDRILKKSLKKFFLKSGSLIIETDGKMLSCETEWWA